MNALTSITRRCVTNNLLQNLNQVRQSHGSWTYRAAPNPPRWAFNSATGVMALTYWWIYWNAFHQFDALRAYYGGKPLPNPSDWTDKELGIPRI